MNCELHQTMEASLNVQLLILSHHYLSLSTFGVLNCTSKYAGMLRNVSSDGGLLLLHTLKNYKKRVDPSLSLVS